MSRLPVIAATTLGLVGLTLCASADKSARLTVDGLRAQGPAGLARALETGDDVLIDQVAAQRHARYSGLFWHTDLDAAIAVAEAEDKPILSLRLLGDLREEYTCANSRFFRAVLYSHPEIAERLREDFVLHWSSERDVPVVSVDFGDGRVLRRTITGNSVHYVLDSDGTPIDAIPGLYAPDAFLGELAVSRDLFERVDASREARAWTVQQHHTMQAEVEARALLVGLGTVRGEDLRVAVQQDGTTVRLDVLLPDAGTDEGRGRVEQARVWMADATHSEDPVPPAVVPMMLAVSKAAVEMPILVAIDGREGSPSNGMQVAGAWTPPQDHEWDDLAALSPASVHPRSVDLMREENALGPFAHDEAAMLDKLRSDLAEDTVRNTWLMRPRIREWLKTSADLTLEDLNRRVYDELFSTPASDPWLGMVDAAAYTGLDDAGWEIARR